MTDTTTETRALIARVRDGIAPADQPQALRDLARTADGEPRVDAEMLRREADEIAWELTGKKLDATATSMDKARETANEIGRLLDEGSEG